MNRLENLKSLFYETIEAHCHGMYKEKAYFHSIQVMTLCQIYAKKRQLNEEIASIIGLFHDYAQFVNQSSFQHGVRSAQLLEPYLLDFSDDEKKTILKAIAQHSDKSKIHDAYSELIKDMDILAKFCDDSSYVFNTEEQKRLEAIDR